MTHDTPLQLAKAQQQNPVKVGLVMLCAATAIALVQYKIPTIMLPLMEIFSLDASLASWLMSIFLLVGVFVALPIGGLAQRFGFKRMILAAFILSLAGAALGIIASAGQQGGLLIASRAIEGVAFTVVTACGPIGVNQCVKPERIGTAMGLFGNWGTLGSTLSSFIVPTVFFALGFEWVWGAVAVITVLAAVLLLVLVPSPMPAPAPSSTLNQTPNQTPSPKPDTQPEPASAQRTGVLHAYLEIFNKDTILFLLGFVAFNLMLLALLAYLPSVLQVKGFDATTSGLITSAPLLLSMISVPVFGIITDRLGRVKPLLVGALLVFGPSVALMFLFTNALLWVGILVLGLGGLGSIGLFLVGWSRVLPRPELVPVGMGVMIFFQCIGQFLGTFITPLLVGPNFDNTLLAGAIISLIGLGGSAMLLVSKFR